MNAKEVRKEFKKICLELNIEFPFNRITFGWFKDEGEFDPIKNQIKIDKADWRRNLRHELRHVWQIKNKILTLDRKWEGVHYSGPYGTEPWEIDAKNFSNKK